LEREREKADRATVAAAAAATERERPRAAAARARQDGSPAAYGALTDPHSPILTRRSSLARGRARGGGGALADPHVSPPFPPPRAHARGARASRNALSSRRA